MNRNIKMGVYTRNGEEVSFNFYTSLSAYNKMRFVNNVTNLVVGDNYNSVIKDMIFNFMIIEVFTDVDTTDINNSDDAINMIEQFLDETNIVDIVKENIQPGLISELKKAVDDNIEYRTGVHKNPVADSISNLLNTIERKLDGIDTESMIEASKVFSGMTGELTAENMLNAYENSDMFKRNYKKLIEDREKHKAVIESVDK